MKGKDLLSEGKEGLNGYRCDYIGGGFDGINRIDIVINNDMLKINTSLYTSSAPDHTYKLSKDIKDLVTIKSKNLNAYKTLKQKKVDTETEIAKNISLELAKFDKAVKMIIDKAVKKIYK